MFHIEYWYKIWKCKFKKIEKSSSNGGVKHKIELTAIKLCLGYMYQQLELDPKKSFMEPLVHCNYLYLKYFDY
jgi:hypothetical protein